MTSVIWYSILAALTGIVLLGPVSLITSLNACNGHGTTQWWADSCTCTGPWTGPACDVCTCGNNAACSYVPGKENQCLCDPNQQWSGARCDKCNGFCTRFDLHYVSDDTTDFSNIPCIGKCLLPCNENLDMYHNVLTKKCQHCTAETTCSGNGNCKVNGAYTANMCQCDAHHWTKVPNPPGAAECGVTCGGPKGCQNGAVCDPGSNEGHCSPVTTPDGIEFVGYSSQLRCPRCVSGQGECHVPDDDNNNVYCRCRPGFNGSTCQHRCPVAHGGQSVCGSGDGDYCNNDGRCVCDGRELPAGESCDCVCSNVGSCVLDDAAGAFRCTCPDTGSFNSDCSACALGYAGYPQCNIRCDAATCNGMGLCHVAPGDVPTCQCSYANMDSTIRPVVLLTEATDRTFPVRQGITYRDPPTGTHISFEQTLRLDGQQYTALKFACGIANPCGVNPFNGSAVNEIDGMVPLTMVNDASSACTIALSTSDNARQDCINDALCQAFSETAGMLFHQVHNCPEEDSVKLQEHCQDDQGARACQYQSFYVYDHAIEAALDGNFIILPTPAPPPPFPTPAVIPGQVTRLVTLNNTDLNQRDQVSQ